MLSPDLNIAPRSGYLAVQDRVVRELLEPARDHAASGGARRRGAIQSVARCASLPGGGGVEVRRKRPLDRLGSALPIRSPASDPNNVRFLILPGAHVPNLASRLLSRLERRVSADWQARFGHPLRLLETFVDPRFFHGTRYRAANWLQVGESRGFRGTRAGYDNRAATPKRVFMRALIGNARACALPSSIPVTTMEHRRCC